MSFSWDEIEKIAPEEWTLPIPPTCPTCGYILTGLPTKICPECGQKFKWSQVRREAMTILSAANRLRHTDHDVRVGLYCIGIGIVSLTIIHLIGWSSIAPLVHALACILGFVGIILGAQVLAYRRIPEKIRPYLGVQRPNLALGLLAIIGGLILMLACFLVA